MSSTVTIDGSQGEGGGQILRTALALAVVTGAPVRIVNIRARRPKPGLQRQHLAAVRAAREVCDGRLEGADLGSREISLTPQAPRGGDYAFDIGSAGSTTLVLQTVLPILLEAGGPSSVTIHGGTHNPMAPPVEFLRESLLPLLQGIGIPATIQLDRAGFYPAGGGTLRTFIHLWQTRTPLELLERGKALGRRAEIIVANLPARVAQRETEAFRHRLHWSPLEIEAREVPAHGSGNALVARLQFAQATAVFTSFGEARKPAEHVAEECAAQVRRYLETDAPVSEHLADQLLLPLALGVGGRFRTGRPSGHTRTNAAIIAAFLGERVEMTEHGDGTWTVAVRGRQASSPWRPWTTTQGG